MDKVRKHFSERRKFGSQTFSLDTRCDTKREANEDAKKLRQKGRLVRVIPNKMIGGREVYLIYSRFK